MRHEHESSKIQSWKWPEFFNRQIVKIRDGKRNNLWIQGNLKAMTTFFNGDHFRVYGVHLGNILF